MVVLTKAAGTGLPALLVEAGRLPGTGKRPGGPARLRFPRPARSDTAPAGDGDVFGVLDGTVARASPAFRPPPCYIEAVQLPLGAIDQGIDWHGCLAPHSLLPHHALIEGCRLAQGDCAPTGGPAGRTKS